MFKKMKLGYAVVALVAIIAIFIGCFVLLIPKGVGGEKQFQLEVITDEMSVVYDITTTQEFLGEALRDEALIEGEVGTYGLYVTSVGAIRADEALQQWWSLSKNGADLMTGVDMTPVYDGDKFAFTLKTGY